MESVPFPRGGKQPAKVNEKRDHQKVSKETTKNEGDEEVLFKVKKQRKVEVVDEKKNKNKAAVASSNKRKREVKESVQNNIMNVGLGMIKTIGNNKIVKIDPLNYGKYIHGTTALGYILQVTEESLTLSLPGGMIAIIPFAEISDIHHKHIHNIDGQVRHCHYSQLLLLTFSFRMSLHFYLKSFNQ
jgi:hypothetical protein